MPLAEILPDKFWFPHPNGGTVAYSRIEAQRAEGNWGGDTTYPATVPLLKTPRGGKNQIKLTPELWKYLSASIHHNEWKRVFAGLINSSRNRDKWPGGAIVPDPPWDEAPIWECLTAVGNMVNVLEIKNDAARIETFDARQPLPDPEKTNFSTHPWLFCKFTSINENGDIGLAPRGLLTIFPLLSEDGYNAWVPLNCLKSLPAPEVTKMSIPDSFARGIDISAAQGSYNPHARPVDFIFIKASEGTSFRDPKFAPFHAAASERVPIIGAYHYFRSGTDWRKQADNFLWAVDAHIQASNLHMLALDYEPINNALDATTDAQADLIVHKISESSGLKTLLYIQYSLIPVVKARQRMNPDAMDIWVARWFERERFKREGAPGIPNWKVWQYGGDYRDPKGWSVPGYKEGIAWGVGSDSVDLDLYNGTPAEMAAWLNVDVAQAQKLEAPEPAIHRGGGRLRNLLPRPR